MNKIVPQSSWVNLLMNLAENNEGKNVSLSCVIDGREQTIGRGHLISIEGDCDGDIVKGFNIVIEGDGSRDANNLFHYVSQPVKIEVLENENFGTIEQLKIYSKDLTQTILQPLEGQFV